MDDEPRKNRKKNFKKGKSPLANTSMSIVGGLEDQIDLNDDSEEINYIQASKQIL